MLKVNSLYHGDCLEVMKRIEDQSIDMVLTDPPYGVTACKWDSVIPLEPMWTQLKRITKVNSAIVLFGSEPFSSSLRMSNVKMYKYDWVYQKSLRTNFLNAKKQPLRNNELISVFYKKQCVYNPQMTKGKSYKKISSSSSKKSDVFGEIAVLEKEYIKINSGTRYPVSVLPVFSQETSLHPTQKPVPLFEYLIKTYTHEGMTVLDFCAGSGTTAIACKNTGRNFILIEKELKYCDIIVKRLQERKNKIYLLKSHKNSCKIK